MPMNIKKEIQRVKKQLDAASATKKRLLKMSWMSSRPQDDYSQLMRKMFQQKAVDDAFASGIKEGGNLMMDKIKPGVADLNREFHAKRHKLKEKEKALEAKDEEIALIAEQKQQLQDIYNKAQAAKISELGVAERAGNYSIIKGRHDPVRNALDVQSIVHSEPLANLTDVTKALKDKKIPFTVTTYTSPNKRSPGKDLTSRSFEAKNWSKEVGKMKKDYPMANDPNKKLYAA